MQRYSIKDLLQLPHKGTPVNYKDQIAIINATLHETDTVSELFAIDAFAI